MPKLKTKSSAKKRFRITARGKVKMPQAGKRHGMIKRTNSQIRKQRGTTIMSKQDAKIVKSDLTEGFFPNPSRNNYALARISASLPGIYFYLRFGLCEEYGTYLP